jgi:hypothetical protein
LTDNADKTECRSIPNSQHCRNVLNVRKEADTQLSKGAINS